LTIVRKIITVGLFTGIVINLASISYAQNEDTFVRQSIVTKKESVILSAIYPGLGQMIADHKYKGLSLFVAETVSLIFAVNAHENYNTKQKVYNKDLDIYNGLATSSATKFYSRTLATYNDLKDTNDELDNLNTVRNTALVAAVIVYAYNVVDAIFFTSPTVESQKAESERNDIIVRSAMINNKPGILLSKSF